MEEEKAQNKRRIIDQSALMQNLTDLSHQHRESDSIEINKDGPFVNGISENNSDPLKDINLVVNKLYNFKDFIEAYNKLTSADLSNIVPYVQIYKIYQNRNEIEEERLIPFNNYYPKSSVSSILTGGSDRGHQANLVSVDFVSQGKDTATMFMYQVKLNIIFDSIQTLFNEKSRYIELFNPPKKNGEYKRGDFDEDYYQIKIKFGWNANTELPQNLKPKELKTFADLSGTEIFLNYVMHKITINEDGSVSLQIEYIGATEMMAKNSSKLNVLNSDKLQKLNDISENIKDIEDRLSEASITIDAKKDSSGKTTAIELKDKDGQDMSNNFSSDKKDLEKYYKQYESEETSGRQEFINSILKNILSQYKGRLPFLRIDKKAHDQRDKMYENYSSLNESEKIDSQLKLSDLEKKYATFIEWPSAKTFNETEDIEQYFINLQENKNDESEISYHIPFFSFGIFLRSIESLGKKENKKESDFIILASDCKFALMSEEGGFINSEDIARHPDYKIYVDNGLDAKNGYAVWKNEVLTRNILEIPIALSTFKYWMTKNVTSQNLSKMSLINFLNLCATDLLNLAIKPINEDYVPRQNINFKFFFDKIQMNEDDSFLKLIRKSQSHIFEILQPEDYKDVKDFLLPKQVIPSKSITKNIIVFYAEPRFFTRKYDFSQDLKDGVPHFYYGSNKGIINKITFREEGMPFVREANIQTQVDRKPWKAGVFLRGKYNVLIEMLGTVNFRIGSLIYVAPSLPGVISIGEPIQYGIGGYFIVISIKTNIESGKYVTSLEANWVSTGEGKYTNLTHLPITVIKTRERIQQTKAKRQEEEKEEAAQDRLRRLEAAEKANN